MISTQSLGILRGQTSATPIDITAKRQDSASAASTKPSSNTVMYIAIGVSVGCALLLAIMGVSYCIFRARKQHRKALADVESGTAVPAAEMEEAPRPTTGIPYASLMPLNSQSSWNELGSNDRVNQAGQATGLGKRMKLSMSMSKKMKQPKGSLLRSQKYLSVITEVQDTSRQASGQPDNVSEQFRFSSPWSVGRGITSHQDEKRDYDLDSRRAVSPLPHVLPSLAISPHSRYGAEIANNGSKTRPVRSISTGVLGANAAVFGLDGQAVQPNQYPRVRMHKRSLSLGANLTKPPSGPVPSLPVIPPLNMGNRDSFRNGVVVALSNSSSMNTLSSADSHILVTSPILKMHDDKQELTTPTVEKVIADKENAKSKSVADKQIQKPRTIIHKAKTSNASSKSSNSFRVQKARVSIRASMLRCSNESLTSRGRSDSSLTSDDGQGSRLSIPRIATADQVSFSRVSSSNSLNGVHTIETPTRRKSLRRSQVSESGSPAQRPSKRPPRREFTAHHDKIPPLRRISSPTRGSGPSSNVHSSQWDDDAMISGSKPSALKGSPNARKAPKRQNCVRISTLRPEVLGPEPQSRSVSPAALFMDDIKEECLRDETKCGKTERKAVEHAIAKEQSQSRAPVANGNISSESRLRVTTLRASLTPSSPILFNWNTYNDTQRGLTSAPSDTNFSVSATSRVSSQSLLIIPRFPSPNKANPSIALSQPETAPTPEFSTETDSPTLGFDPKDVFSFGVPTANGEQDVNPSISENNDEISPDEFSPVSPTDLDLPSSPPLPVSKTKEYDPAWPMLTLPKGTAEEYDPTSPPVVWDDDEIQRSSWFLPFAPTTDELQETTPNRRPTSRALRNQEPPCSPKTILDSKFETLPSRTEKLTSANASSVMANMPEAAASNFLGTSVPVLRPPKTGEDYLYQVHYRLQSQSQPAHRRRSRSCSPTRTPRTGPPAPSLATIPQSDSPPEMPSPLNVAQPRTASRPVPQGPRSAPAKSVIRNVTSLRRMNSEVQEQCNRESRNFVRLGREPSLLLPWAGPNDDAERDESTTDWSDVALDAVAGASSRMPKHESSVMDEIDFESISKNIDGALASFSPEYSFSSSPPTKSDVNRHSTVWEDGESYWQGRSMPGKIPESETALPGTSPRKTPGADKTIDWRVLSTPLDRIKYSSGASGVFGTPKSLYDADGFLKT